MKESWEDQNTAKAEAVAKSINDLWSNRALAVAGDVMDAAYIDTLVKKAAEFGNGKIHIIVNNAGFTWDGVIHKVVLTLSFLSLRDPLSRGKWLPKNQLEADM